MTDFAIYHEGSWRDGQPSKISGATYIVSYDTWKRAYHIQREDYDSFIWWVAQVLGDDERHLQDDEEPDEFLERIGATVREA